MFGGFPGHKNKHVVWGYPRKDSCRRDTRVNTDPERESKAHGSLLGDALRRHAQKMENILPNNKYLQICECFKPKKYEKGKPEGGLNEILVKDPIMRHLL